jgi:hypothetical protein
MRPNGAIRGRRILGDWQSRQGAAATHAPVADHPRMATFIKEFLSYFREDEPDERTKEKCSRRKLREPN